MSVLSCHVNASPSGAQEAAVQKRLFELLDPESQERVTVMRSRYEQMTSVECAAFLQELGLVSIRDREEAEARRASRRKRCVYTSDRLAAVQAREVGYVTLQQQPVAAEDEATFADTEERAARVPQRQTAVGAPMSDLALSRMLTNGLYGEAEVAIRPERVSLYEKIGALEGEEEEAAKRQRASDAASAEAEVRSQSTTIPKPAEPLGTPGRYTYRSNAYQSLRLAYSFPGRINFPSGGGTPGQAPSTNAEDDAAVLGSAPVNVTGFPIYEEELRRWFTALDTEGNGYVTCGAFMSFMRSLEHDFGVQDAYASLERECQRLAQDNRLSFEAFAYLVMRFARE